MCHCVITKHIKAIFQFELYIRQALGTNMHHRAKFRPNNNRSKGCRDMVIYRFSEWQLSAILDF